MRLLSTILGSLITATTLTTPTPCISQTYSLQSNKNVFCDETKKMIPRSIRIIATNSDGTKHYQSPIETTIEEPIDLHAVMTFQDEDKRYIVSDPTAQSYVRPRQGVTSATWKDERFSSLRQNIVWNRIEPEGWDYACTTRSDGKDWHYVTIPFTTITEEEGTPTHRVSGRSTHQAEWICGTLRYQAVFNGAITLQTPGSEAINPKHDSGVFEIRRRLTTGNTLVDAISRYVRVPYLYGNKPFQSVGMYGADCADTVCGALAFLGVRLPKDNWGAYMFAPGAGFATLVCKPRLSGNQFVDGNGSPIHWGEGGVQPDDIIYWRGPPEHVGVLAHNWGNDGIFKGEDLVAHQLGQDLRFQPFVKEIQGSNGPIQFHAYRAEIHVMRLRPDILKIINRK